MKVLTASSVLILALFCAGCGPSLNQVIAKYKDQYAGKREQLRKIQQKLPPKGSVKDEQKAGSLEPKPRFVNHVRSDIEGNSAVFAAEQLSDPEDEKYNNSDQTRLDLVSGDEGDLLECLQLTGPKPDTVAKYSLDSSDQYDFAGKCERGLATKYLVVYRAVQFYEGSADVEVFLVDLDKTEILSRFRVAEELESLTQMTVRTRGLETSAPDVKSAAGKRDAADSSKKSADRNYSDLVLKVGGKIESKFAD